MTTYGSLYEFTDAGMKALQQAFQGELDETAIDPTDPSLAAAIRETSAFRPEDWQSSKGMAQAIINACGPVPLSDLLRRNGLWAWLSFVMRDSLYPRRADGLRKLGEIFRWLPADPNDYQKGQRHLVRMPVLLLSSFGSDADHLLCGAPSVPGEVREQLTSQQDMFHPTIQAATRMLYFDDATGSLRRGVSGKGGGSARRFAQVRKQLDVTWDLFAISPQQLIEKLPAEFDKFRRLIRDGGAHSGKNANRQFGSLPSVSPG
jgi:hypothetical protein